MSFREAVDAFVVSNICIGLGFALCGAILAANRPRHPVGWLWLGGGILALPTALTALAAPSAQLLQDHGASRGLVRSAVTVFNWSWPWHIGLVIPLSLLLLPDGWLPSPRWRPPAWLVVLTAPLFVVEVGTSPGATADHPAGYLVFASHDSLSTLWAISEFRWVLSVLAGVIALVLRYRQGNDQLRRQLLWPLAAAAVVLVAVTPWALVAGTPIAVLFTIPLVPIAITVGILRHQLLDIRVVIARGIAYALLSGIVLGVYALLVIALSGFASALVAALAALPLRSALQRSVERPLYGQRSDPLRVASRVGGGLGAGLAAPLDEIREALRLPWVAVTVTGQHVASSGDPVQATATMPLAADGELVIGLRAGERRLSATDERVLQLLAGPLAVAVQATGLSQELQASRERLIAAREEERRRWTSREPSGRSREVRCSSPEVAGRVLGRLSRPLEGRSAPFPELTPRELEILDLVATGRPTAEIAQRLGLSVKTVGNNVSSILAKLGLADRAQAAVVARDAGLGRGEP